MSGGPSSTWEEIQSVRNKSTSLKEKLAKRRAERQNILNAATADGSNLSTSKPQADKQPVKSQKSQPLKHAESGASKAEAVPVQTSVALTKLNQEDQVCKPLTAEQKLFLMFVTDP